MVNEIEQKELEYVIKRELDEILFDLQDDRVDPLLNGLWMNDIKFYLICSKGLLQLMNVLRI